MIGARERAWPFGGGEMAGLIRDHDWSATPLGPVEAWSDRLRLMVEQVLASPLVASLACGPDRILIYNDAAARLYGARHPAGLGRPLPDAFPEGWAAVAPLYARAFAGETVQVAGQPLDTRGEGSATDAFDALLVPVRETDGRIAYVHMSGAEIGERMRALTALRESEERQAFLLRLSDAMRPLARAASIQGEACRRLGEHFGVDRAYYVAIDEAAGLATVERDYAGGQAPSIAGAHPIADFAWSVAILRRGECHVVADTQDSPVVPPADRSALAALRIVACMGAPLIKAGALVGALCVTASRARDWTGAEVDLLREVGERIWSAIARAGAERALRESEARFAQFAASSSDALWIRDAATLAMEYASPAIRAIYGVPPDALLGDPERWVALILPEDRGTALRHLEEARLGESVVHEFRIRRASDGAERWIKDTDFPIRDERGRVQRIGGIAEDVTELKQVEAALTAAEMRQRALIEGVPQLVWRAVDAGHWTWASPQWTDYTGQGEPDSHDWGWLDPVHPDDREAARAAWGRAVGNDGFEVEYRVYNRAEGRYFWFRTRATPVHDEAGRIVEWLGTSTDIDDLRQMQERQRVLVAELQHRTRNLMGVIRSMSDKTLARSADLPDFRARFGDRLAALARAQGLLSRLDEWDRVTFDELIRSELSVLDGDGDRVTLEGPTGVALRSSTVQTFALALHELTTNALKYGALGQPQGRLEVRWRMERTEQDGRPWLHVEWRESRVAMPAEGTRLQGGGSGRELIERALPYQLGARTTYAMGADGIRCTIALPVSERQAALDRDPRKHAFGRRASGERAFGGRADA